MLKHWKYLCYLIRHKWYVGKACFRRGLYWQGIIHDWSKFLTDEWFPYANYFYAERIDEEFYQIAKRVGGVFLYGRECDFEEAFDKAWLKHQHRNPHHWQYWVLKEDSGNVKLLPIPRKFLLEMVCDWEGAGKAIHGPNNNPGEWYDKTKINRLLHPETLDQVNNLMNEFYPRSSL